MLYKVFTFSLSFEAMNEPPTLSGWSMNLTDLFLLPLELPDDKIEEGVLLANGVVFCALELVLGDVIKESVALRSSISSRFIFNSLSMYPFKEFC